MRHEEEDAIPAFREGAPATDSFLASEEESWSFPVNDNLPIAANDNEEKPIVAM